MAVLAIGHDVVTIEQFETNLEQPGLFSAREIRQARLLAQRKNDGVTVHLAAKWAGKESVIKAWCAALGERAYPYTLERVPWAGIEILDDARGCPHVQLAEPVEQALRASLGLPGGARWHLSLSHDLPIASAVVLLESVDTSTTLG